MTRKLKKETLKTLLGPMAPHTLHLKLRKTKKPRREKRRRT
jgi:hypothetical protein